MAKDSDQNQATVPSTLTADSKSAEKFVQTCWYFVNGKCRNGEKCPRNHDPTLKKSFQNAGLKMTGAGKGVKNEKNKKDSQPAGGGADGKSLFSTLNSQDFRQ